MRIFFMLLVLQRSVSEKNMTFTTLPSLSPSISQLPSLSPSTSIPSVRPTLSMIPTTNVPTTTMPTTSIPSLAPTPVPSGLPSLRPSTPSPTSVPSPVPSLGPGWIEVHPLPSPAVGPVNVTWSCHGEIPEDTLVQVELVTCDANRSNTGDLVGAPLTPPQDVYACNPPQRIEWDAMYLFCPATADLTYVDCVKLDVTTTNKDIKRGLSNRVQLDCTLPTSSDDDGGSDSLFVKGHSWQLYLLLIGVILFLLIFFIVRCRKRVLLPKPSVAHSHHTTEEPLLGDVERGHNHSSHFNDLFVAFPRASSAIEGERSALSEDDNTTVASSSPRVFLQRRTHAAASSTGPLEEGEPFYGSHDSGDHDDATCCFCCLGQRTPKKKNNGNMPAPLSPTSARMRNLVSSNLETGTDDWLLDYERLCMGEMVGVGATSTVFRATYASAVVAAKRIPVFDWNSANKEQLRREAQLLARLHHPNILRFYGVCLHAQHAYVITEFVPETLATRIETAAATTNHRFPSSEFFDLMLGLSFGLEFLHSKYFAHRDVKPSNCLIDGRHLKLCDFGLSKAGRTDAAFVTNTTGVGTPAFMSPEVIMGSSESSIVQPGESAAGAFRAPSDVFSFGMLMYCTFSCRQPFEIYNTDENGNQLRQVAPYAIMSKIANGDRPKTPFDMPHGLKLLVERCWSQLPKNRPSMKYVTAELQQLATTTHTLSSGSPVTELQRPAIDARKRASSLSSPPPPPLLGTTPENNSIHERNTPFSEGRLDKARIFRGSSTPSPSTHLDAFKEFNSQLNKGKVEDEKRDSPSPDQPLLNSTFALQPQEQQDLSQASTVDSSKVLSKL